MLIYSKKEKDPLTILLEGDSTTPSRLELRDFNDLHRTIPSAIYRTVLKDNQVFLLEKNIYSADFFEFFLEFMKSAKEISDVTEVCIEYFLEIIAHAFHNKTMPVLVNVMKECFEKYPGSDDVLLAKLVQDSMEAMINYLLVCTDKVSRNSFAVVLAEALLSSAKRDFSENSRAKIIVNGILSLLPGDVTKHAIRFESYWDLLAILSQSPEISLYFLNKGALFQVIDLYLSGNSPLFNANEQKQTIGNSLWTPNFTGLIRFLCNLDKLLQTNTKTGIYSPTNDEITCLSHKELYEKTLKNDYECKKLGEIIKNWAENDKKYSAMIAEVLLAGVNESEFEETRSFFEVITLFLEIDDEFAGIF